MEKTTVFLVDLTVGSALGKAARGMLAGFVKNGCDVLDGSFGAESKASRNRGLMERISHARPRVVILVAARGCWPEARRIVQEVAGDPLGPPVIIVSEAGSEDDITELLVLGAADYIVAPLRAVDLLPRIRRFHGHDVEQTRVTQRLKEELGLEQLVGRSPSFLEGIEKIPVVAKSDVGILISGETGTGKELFARAIHYLSYRGSKPFVPVNCGAIPVELVENELFGHVRGAFTGADSLQEGLIQEADQGTLFLDEIDCLPPVAQVKLLRFLQGKEYKRLGSKRIERANVRIIASTNINLQKAVQDGTFRQDLYYRLNVVPLVLPPLRDRKDDIPLLARHFLEKHGAELGKEVVGFHDDVLRMLTQHSWPGNVRELENVIERGIIFCKGKVITAGEIAFLVPGRPGDCTRVGSFKSAKAQAVARFEKEYIEQVLLSQKGNITKAALAAGKNRRAFWELMRRHKIDAGSLTTGDTHTNPF